MMGDMKMVDTTAREIRQTERKGETDDKRKKEVEFDGDLRMHRPEVEGSGDKTMGMGGDRVVRMDGLEDE